MIIGLGTDIVSIERIAKVLEKNYRTAITALYEKIPVYI